MRATAGKRKRYGVARTRRVIGRPGSGMLIAARPGGGRTGCDLEITFSGRRRLDARSRRSEAELREAIGPRIYLISALACLTASVSACWAGTGLSPNRADSIALR